MVATEYHSIFNHHRLKSFTNSITLDKNSLTPRLLKPTPLHVITSHFGTFPSDLSLSD